MKKNKELALEWLHRAKSNYACATKIKITSEIMLEDLCYNFQQAAEKALKALCVYKDIEFPKTHSIGYLLELLNKKKVNIPKQILNAAILTEYAVETRYPGIYESVLKTDYQEADKITTEIIEWVETLIK